MMSDIPISFSTQRMFMTLRAAKNREVVVILKYCRIRET